MKKKWIFFILLLSIFVLIAILIWRPNHEISEQKARATSQEALREILEIEEEPVEILLAYQNNQSAINAGHSATTRDYQAYWSADCTFASLSDYRVWINANDGKVVCIERFPIGWFEGKNASEFGTEQNAEPGLEDVVAKTKEYLAKAGYAVKDISSTQISEYKSMMLKSAEGNYIDLPVDYYQISFEYENGERGTIALCKDDLSLLKVWFRPYS